MTSSIVLSQKIGKVIDSSNGEPISNATIQLQNGETLVSDNKGFFSYSSEDASLVISHIGYLSKEINPGSYREDLIISLDAGTFNLQEVVVTAYHDNRKLVDTPGPVALISRKELERDQDLIITNSLNRIPGIFMQSGTLNTNRLTIRGIGSRSLFSTNRVRGFLNEIPLTSGEGETTIEDIDLAMIDRVEIIRGPASSELGAGLGGAINLKTARSTNEDLTFSTNNQIGSYGLFRSVNSFNAGLGNGNFKVISTKTQSDGYRDNNEYDRESVALISQSTLNKTELSFLFNHIKLKAFIPSSLNDSTFRANPRAAAFTWRLAKGFEDYTRTYLGASITQHFSSQHTAVVSFFGSFRNSNEVRPFNILKENTNAFGVRFKYTSELKGKWAPIIVLGGEIFRDNHVFSTHENDDSSPGLILSDNDEIRDYFNYFIQGDWQLNKFAFVAGLNFNKTNYEYEDIFTSNGDQSGDFEFDLIVSPRIGVNYKINPFNALHATVSHGFAPPTLEETLTPDGQINPEIKPESGYNYEIGARGTIQGNRLSYDLTLFTMRIKNLLVARRVGDDQFVGVNAGKTTHNGIEAAFGYQIHNSTTGFIRNINAHLNYTLASYKFDVFIDGEDDFGGNNLTGTPKNTMNGILELETSIGISANLNYRFVDEMPMRDDNSIFSDAYSITNFKIDYMKSVGKFAFNLYAGINNLFDEHYASMILVNASSFGGAAPRYFYPGQDRNYFGGISLSLTI